MKHAAVLPGWIRLGLMPVLNVAVAFLVAGLVVLMIGESPLQAVSILLHGSLGSIGGIGFTLYYATNFIFTGLAVAVAFHAGLFNIGGEGQAMLGGLGVALVCLYLDFLPAWAVVPLAIAGAGIFGAAWAAIPGWLQARRGSHIVITTIMFNFLAAALLVYLLVNVMGRPDSMQPETPTFAPHAQLPQVHELLAGIGIAMPPTPLNLSFLWALVCAFLVWLLIWHTVLGYEIRTVGKSPPAALYAGIGPSRVVVITMLISGALAGFLGLNEIMGAENRLILDFTAGYGFVGIAVALMGRSHPLGVILASLLFGALYQGGTELAFDIPAITRDMIVLIQGLVILFAAGLETMFAPLLTRIVIAARRAEAEQPGANPGT